jgi:hypothetical protein
MPSSKAKDMNTFQCIQPHAVLIAVKVYTVMKNNDSKALDSFHINSKLAWECLQSLMLVTGMTKQGTNDMGART